MSIAAISRDIPGSGLSVFRGFSTLCIAFLLLLGLFACDSSDDESPPPDGDTEADEAAPTDGDTDDEAAPDGDDDGDGDDEADADAEPEATALELTVMTYNVLCSFCDNSYDPWEERLDYQREIYLRHDPDLIGTQEIFSADEVDEILAKNPEYSALYFHDPEEQMLVDYPDACILYRTERFEALEEGYYWLSDTPDEAWSTGWANGNLPRLVGWARFRDRPSGLEFYIANTHFDNNTPNQAMSAPLAISRTEPEAAEAPVIFTGDFNSKPDSEAYATLSTGIDGNGFQLVNSFDIAESWRVESNQATPPDYDPAHRIDHIWLQGPSAWTCSEWVVDVSVYGENDMPPSDHYPMIAACRYEP